MSHSGRCGSTPAHSEEVENIIDYYSGKIAVLEKIFETVPNSHLDLVLD
jgi:hypothetical protein